MSTRDDGETWEDIDDLNSNAISEFYGPDDFTEIATEKFETPFKTNKVRIVPTEWIGDFLYGRFGVEVIDLYGDVCD
jgi:hypothetical protein